MLLSSFEKGDIAGADLMTLTIVACDPATSFDDDPKLAEARYVPINDSARFNAEEMGVCIYRTGALWSTYQASQGGDLPEHARDPKQ